MNRYQFRLATGRGSGGGMRIKPGSETQDQIALANWIKFNYPDLLWTASAGGMRTSIGTAKKMKAMGYSKGFPDIFIYEKRKGFGGLAIELKKEKGSYPTAEQKQWQERLIERGYFAEIAHGAENAKKAIKEYLENNPPE